MLRTRAIDRTYFRVKRTRILRVMAENALPAFGFPGARRAQNGHSAKSFRKFPAISTTPETVFRGKGGVEWVGGTLMHRLRPWSSIGGVVGYPVI